jgi:hypothetical protein
MAAGVWMLRRGDPPVTRAAVPSSDQAAAIDESPPEKMAANSLAATQSADNAGAAALERASDRAAIDPRTRVAYPLSVRDSPVEAFADRASFTESTTTGRDPERETSADAQQARATRPAEIIEGVGAIAPGMLEYGSARHQLDLFLREMSGARTHADWWNISVRIYNDPEMYLPELAALRYAELAVSQAWRSYLDGPHDPVTSAALKEFAEELTRRVRLYVR